LYGTSLLESTFRKYFKKNARFEAFNLQPRSVDVDQKMMARVKDDLITRVKLVTNCC